MEMIINSKIKSTVGLWTMSSTAVDEVSISLFQVVILYLNKNNISRYVVKSQYVAELSIQGFNEMKLLKSTGKSCNFLW